MVDETGYKEIARVPLNDGKTDFIVSEVWKGGMVSGVILHTFITTPKYTGPTKGPFIPKAKLAEIQAAIAKLH